MRRIIPQISIAWMLAPLTSQGGEIAGLPPHLPPTTRPDYTFFLGNDFLAPGTNDDFRTQQIIASARIRDRWLAVLDHSILTRKNAVTGPPARIDLMSLSVGYEWYRRENENGRSTIAAGLGARGVGNFDGARIQNGFHTLTTAGTSFLPYADTRQTDGTAWFLGETYKTLRPAGHDGFLGNWDTGYWIRAGALTTTDGQFDGMAGVYAIAARPGIDAWLGLRRDWREGYTADAVQRETMSEENKAALSWGFRFGPLVLETVHRFDSRASFGQMTFVSSMATRKEPATRPSRADLQFSLQMPHMLFQVAGRWHRHIFLDASSRWRESLVVELRGGQPQLGHDVTRFAETAQLSAGLEWSRQIADNPDWLRFYAGTTLGYRWEHFVGRGPLDGVKSRTVGSAVLAGDVGIEIDAFRIDNHWRHRLRLGVTGWLPSDSPTVMAGGLPIELLEPGVSINVSLTLTYH